jgi:alpha-glucosidase
MSSITREPNLAQIYQDAPDADYRTNPLAYEIIERTVTAADRLTLALAPGGGAAIRFKAPASREPGGH